MGLALRTAAGCLAAAWCGSIWAAAPVYEPVSFASTDESQTVVKGLVFHPSGSGPFAAVLGVHGCNGLFEGAPEPVEHYVSWGTQLREAGFLVLLMDSLGSRGIPTLCATPGPSTVRANRELVSDALGAHAYLQGRADVRKQAIGMIGWSMGGDAALWTISSRKAFQAAIAFYPGGCAAALRRKDWSPAVPLLLQLGEADDYGPPKPCIELANSAKARGFPVELDLYAGAYHLFDHPSMPAHPYTRIVFRDGTSPMIGADPAARAAALARVKGFFKTHLGP